MFKALWDFMKMLAKHRSTLIQTSFSYVTMSSVFKKCENNVLQMSANLQLPHTSHSAATRPRQPCQVEHNEAPSQDRGQHQVVEKSEMDIAVLEGESLDLNSFSLFTGHPISFHYCRYIHIYIYIHSDIYPFKFQISGRSSGPILGWGTLAKIGTQKRPWISGKGNHQVERRSVIPYQGPCSMHLQRRYAPIDV